MDPSWVLTALLCAVSFCLGGYLASQLIGTTIRKSIKALDWSKSLKSCAIDIYNEAAVFYNDMAKINRKTYGLPYDQLPDKPLMEKEKK